MAAHLEPNVDSACQVGATPVVPKLDSGCQVGAVTATTRRELQKPWPQR